MRAQASILVGVLWCLALLSVVVIGVLHTARLDLLVVKNYGDQIQAHYLALAGIEKAKALLYQDGRDRSKSRTSHTGQLFDDPAQFREVAFGRGHFQIFRRGRNDEGGAIMYGVSDEESRLNVNFATTNEFAKLQNMTPDVAAAIIDWRDDDNAVSPGGAEAEYYSTLNPPYLPRNGPIQTIREMLMIRGVSSDLLFGNDDDQNGLLGEGLVGQRERAVDSEGALEDAGWSALMTVDSSVENLNAAGEQRVNIQTADEATLTGVKGITPEIARAVVAYRNQNQFKSVADLLDVPPADGQNQGGGPGNQPGQNSQNGGQQSNGPRVIDDQLLMEIADDLTAESNQQLDGVINVNSAGLDVLVCLPGIDRDLAQAIINYRQSSGFLPNIAWLLKVPGMTHDIFKQMAPMAGTKSETYRIVSEGRVDSSGARQRIQVIVRVGLRDIGTLSYREDL